MNEIMVAQYGLSALLTVIMGIIYKFFELPDGSSSLADKWKTLLIPLAGMFLGLLGMTYQGEAWTAKIVITYLVNGFMSGAASIGLWKLLGAVNTKGPAAPKPIVPPTP